MFHPPTKKTDVDAMLHPADVPGGTKRKRDGHHAAAEDPIQLFWRAQLEAIYRRRNPPKLESIPGLLEKYQGNEAVLYRKVCEKYDLNPSKFHTDPEAWMEYDLTDHHGPKEGKTMVIKTSEVLEVTVTNMSGTNSCNSKQHCEAIVDPRECCTQNPTLAFQVVFGISKIILGPAVVHS